MVQRYTKIAMTLHWLVAAGVFANIALAWSFPYLGDAGIRPAIDTHKSIGITVLGLALLRLLWRIGHKPPPFPTAYAGWEKAAAHVVHWGLYLVIFAMPLTGWIMDSAYKDAATHPMYLFGLFQWPRIGMVLNLPPATRDHVHDLFGAAHGLIAYVVYALVAVHIAAALKHQWRDRQPELQRMWPSRR